MTKIDALERIATRLRIHSLRMTTQAGSGHPTTCLSAADLAACLFFGEMRFDPRDPSHPAADEFVLSKGHAAPLLWAVYAEAGLIPLASLLDLRKFTSDLEGHPTPRMPWVKAATGSLGQGLSVGVGIALAQRFDKSKARTFVLMGDGECAEGQVWEAANAAARYGLRNLCAVVDVNRLGQSDPTMHGHDLKAYAAKFRAFGWDVVTVDGHRIPKILDAYRRIGKAGKPMAIIARTVKGKGVSFIEDLNGWHGRPLKADELARALGELGCLPDVDAKTLVRMPKPFKAPRRGRQAPVPRTAYTERTATRLAYGNAVAALGKVDTRVVALDGDVKNSTYHDKFFAAVPERSIQVYIAEQNMVGIAMGLAIKGFIPFAATFAAFITRAHDQVRMAGYSFSNIKLCGSHAGASIGEDGPSQMGLEDLAMFRPVPGCVVLYPADASAAEGCVATAADHKGMCYIRTTRPATALLYGRDEAFPAGGSKVLRRSERDEAVIIAAGITVHEALQAAAELGREGIGVRVIDAYSVQPLDVETMRVAAKDTGGKVVVVEDHYPAGGLGEAVAMALAGEAKIAHLCVRELPRSGKPQELLDAYGISARSIVAAVKTFRG
ncbi:MAG: transketolase, partial [Candidatus Aminicenantes bacterium]|nr:transketolase [Candidatus Aminicenantes bacterium]